MKTAVLIYHRDVRKKYKEKWINKCLHSILNQTYQNFEFYEIDYGGNNDSILNRIDINKNKKYWSITKKNYASAMNFLLEQTYTDGCECVFNINIDDFYNTTRFEKQIKLIEKGYDLVSSDFCYVKENNENEDEIILHMNICKQGTIENNFEIENNIIAHPSVCYSRNFIKHNKYNDDLIPAEDFDLWKKTISKYKFHIIDEELLFYRIHDKQVSNKT